MPQTIQIKRSSGNAAPGSLLQGEFAWVDHGTGGADGKLYVGDAAAGTIIDIAGSTYLKLDSGAMTGSATAPTPTAGDVSTRIATTAFVDNALLAKDTILELGDTDIGDIVATQFASESDVDINASGMSEFVVDGEADDNVEYTTETNYIQQEWTNQNQSTSQATVSGTTATLSSGTWPTNAVNGRISFDAGSTWVDIDGFGLDGNNSDVANNSSSPAPTSGGYPVVGGTNSNANYNAYGTQVWGSAMSSGGALSSVDIGLYCADPSSTAVYHMEVYEVPAPATSPINNISTYLVATSTNTIRPVDVSSTFTPTTLYNFTFDETFTVDTNKDYFFMLYSANPGAENSDDAKRIKFPYSINSSAQNMGQSWGINKSGGNYLSLSWDKTEIQIAINLRTFDYTEVELASSLTAGTFDYKLRMSEFDSGSVKLNEIFLGYGTDETSPSSTVSGSSNGLANLYTPASAVDNNDGFYGFCTLDNVTTGWWKIDFGPGITKTITKYRIYGRNNGGRLFLTNTMKDFQLQGSNNDSDWTTVDSVVGKTSWLNMAFEDFESFSGTPAAYRYYRINMTANNGGTNVGFGQIELLQSSTTNPISEYVSVVTSESHNPNTTGWVDLNSASITETTDSNSNAHYWLGFDPATGYGGGTEVKIFHQDDSLWRTIAKNNAGTWEYNSSVPSPAVSASDLTSGQTYFSSESEDHNTLNAGGFDDNPNPSINHHIWLTNGAASAIAPTGSNPSVHLGVQFSSAKTIAQYTIVGWVNFSGRTSGEAPKTWTFEGSNDGTNYTTLDTQTNVSAWTSGEKRTYQFSNSTSYLYYRIVITEKQANSSSRACIAEMEMMDAGTPEVLADVYSGTSSSTNNMLHAISEGISSNAANRMTEAQAEAITDAEFEATDGFVPGTHTSLFRGTTLYSTNTSSNASVDQYTLNFTGSLGDNMFGRSGESALLAQVFQASDSNELHSAKMFIKTVGSPTDNVRLKLYSVTGNVGLEIPDQLLDTSDDVAASGMTGTYAEYTFDFLNGVDLVSGTKYAIVAERSGSLDNTNYYRAQGQDADVYNLGHIVEYDGVNWTVVSDKDLSLNVFTNVLQEVSPGHMMVYDGVDSWDNKEITGAMTVDKTGATTLTNSGISNIMISGTANITNDKLENSTISGHELGTDLSKLTAGRGFAQNTVSAGYGSDITSGQTFTASAFLANGQQPDKAFDDDVATYWNATNSSVSPSSPEWIKVEFTSAKTIAKITLNSGNNCTYSYTVEGSNDDASWTTLLTINSKAYPIQTTVDEVLTTTGSFTYYRLHFTSSSTTLYIREIEMMESLTSVVNVEYDGTAPITFNVDGVLEDLDTLGASSADGEFIVADGTGSFAYESGSTVRDSIGLGAATTPTFTGMESSGGTIINVALPTNPQDLATQAYVTSVEYGFDFKESVVAATTADLSATYNNGTSGVGATLTGSTALPQIDGISLSNGHRMLVKDQTNTAENGIYVVTDASNPFTLTRAEDADNSSEFTAGAFVFVEQGTAAADNSYLHISDGAITFGTSGIDWVQFTGAGMITAGTGLTKSGNTLQIDPAYIGQATITDLGTISSGTWEATRISATYGGTDIDTGSSTGIPQIVNGTWTVPSTVAPLYGGLGLDTSSSSGLISVSGGTWTVDSQLDESEGGTGIDTSGSTGIPQIINGTWTVPSTVAPLYGGTGTDSSAETGLATVNNGVWEYIPILDETQGGSGSGTWTTGDMMVADDTNTLTALGAGVGNGGKVMNTNDAAMPTWTDIEGGVMSSMSLQVAINSSGVNTKVGTADSNPEKVGQTALMTSGGTLNKVQFKLKRIGNPTDTYVAKVAEYTGGSVGSSSKDIDNNSVSSNRHFGFNDVEFGGNTFIPNTSGVLTEIKVGMASIGSPTDNVFLTIFATTAGSVTNTNIPTGSVLATSASVSGTTFPGNSTPTDNISFTFSGANQINLTAGVEYAWVAQRSGGVSSTNQYTITTSNASGFGNYLEKDPGSNTWETSAAAGSTHCYEVYVAQVSSGTVGSVLATSDARAASTVSTLYNMIEYNFSGANKISLSNATEYAFYLERTGTLESSNILAMDTENADSYADGEAISYTLGDAPAILLLHGDGSDNGTTFTDSGSTGHIATVNGNVHTDTSIKKFGTASMQFDGSGDYLTFPDHTDWDLFHTTSSTATVDFWVYFNSQKNHAIVAQGLTSGHHWGILIGSDWRISLARYATGGVYDYYNLGYNLNNAAGLTTGQWFHIALIKGWLGNASNTAITVNGTPCNIASISTPGSGASDAGTYVSGDDMATVSSSLSGDLVVGRWAYNHTSYDLNGYIDELRITNSARWTSNFTPPTSAHVGEIWNTHTDREHNLQVWYDDV